jgi:hypothetical protein
VIVGVTVCVTDGVNDDVIVTENEGVRVGEKVCD